MPEPHKSPVCCRHRWIKATTASTTDHSIQAKVWPVSRYSVISGSTSSFWVHTSHHKVCLLLPSQRILVSHGPSQSTPVQIMTNPNRGRGGYANGRVGQHQDSKTQSAWSPGRNIGPSSPSHNTAAQSRGPSQSASPPSRGSPSYPPRGGFTGRGRGFYPQVERGRGGPTRGAVRGRGRGRSDYAPPLPS